MPRIAAKERKAAIFPGKYIPENKISDYINSWYNIPAGMIRGNVNKKIFPKDKFKNKVRRIVYPQSFQHFQQK